MTAAEVIERWIEASGCEDMGLDPHDLMEMLWAAGHPIVRLPERPSEYWGPQHQPQWNHYPFTRVDGDQIEIGARSEHVYRVNATEAITFAADIMAAARVAELS